MCGEKDVVVKKEMLKMQSLIGRVGRVARARQMTCVVKNACFVFCI